MNLKFGEWQAHTSGFGSKYLQKLGYQEGKGLGKNQQGILNPISLAILPSNTSLDACIELKKKGLLNTTDDKFTHEKQGNYFKNLILKKNQKKIKKVVEDKSGSNKLFDTLNQTLATKSKLKETTSIYTKLKIIQKETKNIDDVHVNIFKIEAEISRLRNEISICQKSIKMCQEMNPSKVKKLNEDLISKQNDLTNYELRLKVLKEKKKRNKYDRNVKYF